MSSPIEDDPRPPVPKKRRSSILARKSIGIGGAPICKDVADKQYISEASQEIQEWRELHKERKQRSMQSEQALAEVTSDPPVLNYDSVKDDLTQEDKDFLAQRPDYGKLIADFDSFLEEFSLLQCNTAKLELELDSALKLIKSRNDLIAKGICSFNKNTPVSNNRKPLN